MLYLLNKQTRLLMFLLACSFCFAGDSVITKGIKCVRMNSSLLIKGKSNTLEIAPFEWTSERDCNYFYRVEYGPGASYWVYIWKVKGSVGKNGNSRPSMMNVAGEVFDFVDQNGFDTKGMQRVKFSFDCVGKVFQRGSAFQVQVQSIAGFTDKMSTHLAGMLEEIK